MSHHLLSLPTDRQHFFNYFLRNTEKALVFVPDDIRLLADVALFVIFVIYFFVCYLYCSLFGFDLASAELNDLFSGLFFGAIAGTTKLASNEEQAEAKPNDYQIEF